MGTSPVRFPTHARCNSIELLPRRYSIILQHATMSPLILRRLRDKFWPEPLPPVKSFEGQTVLVTGATAGLGLAAALHFATLGASVVITSRSLPQGNGVKDEVEKRAGIVGQGKIHVIELDLSRYSSCLAFVDRLKEATATRRGLDVAVLNAGLINAEYVQSPEGWLVHV